MQVSLWPILLYRKQSRGRSRNLPQSSKNPNKTLKKNLPTRWSHSPHTAGFWKKSLPKNNMTRITNRTNNVVIFIPKQQIFDASWEGPLTFSGWWFQRFFYVHPDPWGKWIQFGLMFFRWVVQPPTSFEFSWVLNVTYQKVRPLARA